MHHWSRPFRAVIATISFGRDSFPILSYPTPLGSMVSACELYHRWW